jgi:hypothetical protein
MPPKLTREQIKKRREEAANGDPRLQYEFGLLLKQEPQLGKEDEFMIWLAAAAEAGNGDACWELAETFLAGELAPKNLDKVHIWLSKGAALKHPTCLYNLGVQYMQGAGVRQDLRAGFRYFRRAASLGDLDALFNLAVCYGKGIGTRKDVKRAMALAAELQATGDERGRALVGHLAKESGAPAQPNTPAQADVQPRTNPVPGVSDAVDLRNAEGETEEALRDLEARTRALENPPPCPRRRRSRTHRPGPRQARPPFHRWMAPRRSWRTRTTQRPSRCCSRRLKGAARKRNCCWANAAWKARVCPWISSGPALFSRRLPPRGTRRPSRRC